MDKNMDNIIIALRQSREYRENSNFKVAETYIDVLTFNYLTSMNAKKIGNGLSLDEGLVEAVNIGKEIKDDDRSKILLKLGIEEPENLEMG
jgi:hypothetical protein